MFNIDYARVSDYFKNLRMLASGVASSGNDQYFMSPGGNGGFALNRERLCFAYPSCFCVQGLARHFTLLEAYLPQDQHINTPLCHDRWCDACTSAPTKWIWFPISIFFGSPSWGSWSPHCDVPGHWPHFRISVLLPLAQSFMHLIHWYLASIWTTS